jgi:hypothetical protein
VVELGEGGGGSKPKIALLANGYKCAMYDVYCSSLTNVKGHGNEILILSACFIFSFSSDSYSKQERFWFQERFRILDLRAKTIGLINKQVTHVK